jgi:CheY-like chemotaxis protein
VYAYLRLCAYTQNREKKEKEGDSNVQGARILLIEDDAVLRELMERNLRVRHHAVSIAIDAESALRHLRTSTFDLIILDINLPDLSGWDVLRIIKRELQPSGRGHEGILAPHPVSPEGDNANGKTPNMSNSFARSEERMGDPLRSPISTPLVDMPQEEKLPVVVVSAVRVSPHRLSEFRPLAYLPKPFPMEALLRLAVEAARRRMGVDQSVPDEEESAPHDVMLSPSREEEYDEPDTA